MLIGVDHLHSSIGTERRPAGSHSQPRTHMKREQEEVGGAMEIWKSSACP